MDAQFTKPKTNAIDHDSITLECVEQQLKSMQLGYISHCFIVKGLEDDFDVFYEANFKDVTDEIMAKAEPHALKHLETLDHLQGETLKNIPADIQQCIQGLLMIKEKRAEIEANSSKAETMKRNISWLKDLYQDIKDGELKQEPTKAPEATPAPSADPLAPAPNEA